MGLSPGVVQADDDDDDHEAQRQSVTVSFGRGLNTAQPGNPANHAILPGEIRVQRGGVVNFAVGGFHQIMVYQPGKDVGEVILPPVVPPATPPPFINDLTELYYQGIAPAGGPLGTAVTGNPANASNRMETVSFATPGTYLVICNVRGHFLDGMFAIVKVSR